MKSILGLVTAALFFSNLTSSTVSWAQSSSSRKRTHANVFATNELVRQYQISVAQMINNLPAGADQVGSVAASPSQQYQFHWTRDGALVWNALLAVYQNTGDRALKANLLKRFQEWARFEKKALASAAAQSLTRGEPKFQLDGGAFTGEWGRPQNDGPALRALVMSQWAFQLLSEGEKDFVQRELYNPSSVEITSLIKGDLEYSAKTWNVPSFDPWEEVKGLNYYNVVMQRKALIIGASLAETLNDPFAARYYREKAQEILNFLPQFHDGKKGYIISVVNQTDGWTHKTSKLDAAVILATIHGQFDVEYMRSSYLIIHATALELERVFREIYPINKQNTLAVAIGRYPEDVYDGFGFSGGNPWFLTTHAFAEYYCRLAQANPSQRDFLRGRGLDFLQRALAHRHQETGEMSEQLDRRNGYLTGVSHLTWSYASFITAALSCGLGQ